MRIFYLSDMLTVVLCFAVWLVLQVSAAVICLNLPDRFFSPNAYIFRTHHFEKNGRIYETMFHITKWKHLLPDGAAVWKKTGYRKKKINNFSSENLNQFLIESARAEMTHWLAIFPFFIFWFFTPPIVPWVMLVYALIVNFPCVVAQRYNRPRIKRLLKKINNHKNNITI